MTSSKGAFDRTLGKRIRQARERVGMKQDQLARAVGLSRTSITNIERGRQGVQVYLLARLADVLGQSASELLPRLDEGASLPTSIPEEINLEPSQRAWAERVIRSAKENDDHAS